MKSLCFSLEHSSLCFAGAKKAREVIYVVLRDACASGDLSLMEAIDAAKDIFSRNSIGFYKLDIDINSSSPQNTISLKLEMKEPDVQEDSSSFVRIIWVDTSGQQRCRVSFFFFFFLILLKKPLFLCFSLNLFFFVTIQT